MRGLEPARRGLTELVAAWPAFAIAAAMIVLTPVSPWRLAGPLTAALVVGILVRSARDLRGSRSRPLEDAGVRTLATHVLRAGVVLGAVRLDWVDVVAAGSRPWLIAASAVVGGLLASRLLARVLRVEGTTAALVAIGTSVCGAAAITAAVPHMRAKEEEATLSIAIISVLGALFANVLAALAISTHPDANDYALLTGGALHEVAHVAAAGAAMPDASGVAMLTKLSRVAMLPIALIFFARAPTPAGEAPVPVGVPRLAVAFFAVSAVATAARWAPGFDEQWSLLRGWLLEASHLGLAVAMAAIGMRVSIRDAMQLRPQTLVFALGVTLAVFAVVGLAIVGSG